MVVFLHENNKLIGGVDEHGDSLKVKIDESLFSKRKYILGRLNLN